MCIRTEILPITGIPVLANQDCMGWDRMWAQKTTTRRLIYVTKDEIVPAVLWISVRVSARGQAGFTTPS